MKRKLISVLCFIIAFGINPAHSQLFKKLKEKVNETVDKTISPADSGSTSNDNQAATGQSGQAQQINFGTYSIITLPAMDPSVINEKHQQFEDQYTGYAIKNNDIIGTVVIYAGNEEGEGGNFSGNSSAYIFENGKMVQHTTVANEEKKTDSLRDANNRYDWPYGYQKNILDPVKSLQKVLGSNVQCMPVGFIANRDKSKFYSVVGIIGTEDDVPYFLVAYDGKKIKLPSAASGLISNIDFSGAAVYGFVKTYEENKEKDSNVLHAATNSLNQGDIYFIDGHVIKNATNISAGGAAWLDPSGKNYLTADENFGAYINGKKIVDKGPHAGHVWCNADAAHWCYFNDQGDHSGHLVFSDGADIPNAFHPVQIILNGKNYMVWFSYSNVTDGNLLLCKKLL